MVFQDEFFHEPSNDEHWSESFYLDFVQEEIQGFFRFGFYPNKSEANIWAYLLLDRVYYLRDESFPLDRTHGLTFQGKNWTVSYRPGERNENWILSCTGDFTKTDPPGSTSNPQTSSSTVELKLKASTLNPIFYYSEGKDFPDVSNFSHWEQSVNVTGRAEVDDEEISINAHGTRDHSWGTRKWGDDEWLGDGWMWLNGGFKDGTTFTCMRTGYSTDHSINGFWFNGSRNESIHDLDLVIKPELNPETARNWSRGKLPVIDLSFKHGKQRVSMTVEPFTATPLEHNSENKSLLSNRSPCRIKRDNGATGSGFVSSGVPTQNEGR